jgi:ABC-type Co2+ transport system permease subunit
MLVYDHERTEKIVQRLRDAERAGRWAVVAFAVVLLAALGALMGRVAGTAGGGMVAGSLLGVMIGMYATAVVSAVMEWMCQLLIAHGAMVARAAEDRPGPNN